MRKEGQSRESYELEYYERTGGGETADQIIKTLGPEISAIKGKVSFNRKRQRFMWACMVMNTVLLLIIIVFLGILTLILNNISGSVPRAARASETETTEEVGPCALQLNGDNFTHLMLTDTTETQQVAVTGHGLASCQDFLQLVAGANVLKVEVTTAGPDQDILNIAQLTWILEQLS